jgi:hypothetical protein
MRRYRAKRRAEREAQAVPLPEDLLSVPEAAQFLGLTVAGIRAALKRGTLTAVSLEGRPHRTFFAREELECYRQDHCGQRGRRPQGTSPAPATL